MEGENVLHDVKGGICPREMSYSQEFCPSVCPSRSCVVSKRLNTSSQFLHHTVAQSS